MVTPGGRVALGCGNFGGVGSAPEFFGQGLNRDQAFALMDAAWELGITHFDTADAYGGGRSETAIGALDRGRAGSRPQLTTKTYNPMAAGGRPRADAGAHRPPAASRASTGSGSTGSTCTWRTNSTRTCRCPRSIGAVRGGAGEGAIGAYGVSNFDAAQLRGRACGRARRRRSRTSYSLLTRRDDEDGPAAVRRASRSAYLAFSPLAGGWLTGKYRPRRAVPGRLADDPAPRALRDVRRPTRPSTALERARRDRRAAAASRWPASRSPGCSPTSG